MTNQGTTADNSNHQYWLGRLRDAEANPSGWVSANPQQGGGGGQQVQAPAVAANNTDPTYWLGQLNQAETRAQRTSGYLKVERK
jgi:hypothetical protein